MAVSSIFVISDTLSLLEELCAGARALSDEVTAFLFGDEAAAQGAAGCGAHRILYCPVSEAGAPEDYARAIAAEIKQQPAALVLVGNTIRGRLLAGKIGVYLDTAVLSNVAELSEVEGALACRRTVYGGLAQAQLRFTKPYGVVTMGSGVLEAVPPLTQAQIAPISGAPEPSLRRIARSEKQERSVNLAAAKRIVDAGRGLAAESDLSLCYQLASALEAEVGCSRPVAENNKWLPKANYMGITGVQVKPDLIVTVGVSGQVQHIGGINKAKLIVAINKDKAAPIFKHADFGLVGDLYKVLPALIEKLS